MNLNQDLKDMRTVYQIIRETEQTNFRKEVIFKSTNKAWTDWYMLKLVKFQLGLESKVNFIDAWYIRISAKQNEVLRY